VAPQPTGRYGLLRIPAPTAHGVSIRFSSLVNRDQFNPAGWPSYPLVASAAYPGWWEFDIDAQALADGTYEYEFLLNADPNNPVSDPYADAITRFGGYRGLFHVAAGKRVDPTFRWDPGVEAGGGLAQNNQIVVYEMPLKWMSSATDNSLVDLGTFDEVIFEHLDSLKALGINCIELLPIEDTSQTLDWGYGTRFYFAPDYDMGTPVDAKFFVESCHARGIRVILDVVMAFFSPTCPLGTLASPWFMAPQNENGRNGWGQNLFEYNLPAYDTYYAAREFLCQMAEFWVTEYHIDGFRIDDFPDIDNWDFVQEFHDRATAASTAAFPGKPFLVVAENSNRQFVTTGPDPNNPNGRKVVDAIWNFGFQQEIRQLATGSLTTSFGQASRTLRVQHLLSKDGTWNGLSQSFDPGYADMACAVNYATSHDVQGNPRMMNVILGPMLPNLGLGSGDYISVKAVVDNPQNPAAVAAVQTALNRVFGVFALIMTSVGIPIFLAGEEFADVHDTDYNAVDSKQQDPVQWQRADPTTHPANAALQARNAALIQLRTSSPALQRNEIAFFYFHPSFDDNNGTWVFAYARTNGVPLGTSGQIIVLVNMCAQSFGAFVFPAWPWGTQPLREIGPSSGTSSYDATSGAFSVSLDAFQVRVFSV
jgi:pullulanase/glycogen debranching enzyme